MLSVFVVTRGMDPTFDPRFLTLSTEGNYMKKLINFGIVAAILSMFTVFAAPDLLAQKRPTIRRASAANRAATYAVPSGKKFRVRMNDTISSKTASVGDTFTAVTVDPVYSTNGSVVIPQGSEVVGRVNTVTRARKGGNPGAIDVSFNQVRLPNGVTRRINGSLTDLDSDDATSDSEGTASGDKMKHRKIIFIGGGGAGGAVLGGAIGGGKGALIGALLGAGAGFLGDRYTKGEEVEVRAGTEFGVILNQGVSLPRYAEANTGSDDNYSAPSATGGGQTYIVRPGDTLGKISQRFYGNTRDYMRIYEANRDRLRSPSSVEVGQELIIP